MLITFSGIDGAGKSTLLRDLEAFLAARKRSTVVFALYDHLSFYSILRRVRDRVKTFLKLPLEKRDSGKEQALLEKKIPLYDPAMGVRDKTGPVQKFLYGVFRSTWARQASLLLDIGVMLLCRVYFEGIRKQIILTDRYLYDTVVDISYQTKRTGFLRRFLFPLIPSPDIAVFVDVLPETAFERKCEYPLEYLRWRRKAYQEVFARLRNPFVLPNDDLKQSRKLLVEWVTRKMGIRP